MISKSILIIVVIIIIITVVVTMPPTLAAFSTATITPMISTYYLNRVVATAACDTQSLI